MKKRIFSAVFWTAAAAALIMLALTALAAYAGFKGEVLSGLAEVARADALYLGDGDAAARLKELGGRSGSRVTLVAADGEVLYDSYADADELGNHLDRPEIAAALSEGEGRASRRSDTLGQTVFYFALRLDNGEVLRVSRTANSALGELRRIFPAALLALAAVAVASHAVARVISEKLTRPLLALGSGAPQDEDAYEELTPLLIRLKEQRARIEDQLRCLKTNKSEFLSIIDRVEVGILVLNEDGAVVAVNRAALGYFGVEEAGDSYLTLSRGEDYLNAVSRALAGEPSDYTTFTDAGECDVTVRPVDDRGDDHDVVLFINRVK